MLAWFAKTPDDALFLSALTLGEIRKSVVGYQQFVGRDGAAS